MSSFIFVERRSRQTARLRLRFLYRASPVICLISFVITGLPARLFGEDLAHKAFSDPQVVSLAEAVAAGDVKQIRDLAARGVPVNSRGDHGMNLLQWSVLNRSSKGLAALLDAGADPTQGDDSGDTVVRFAAMANDPIYLQVLLAHHIDPNTPQRISGETPLESALLGNRDRQFAMLLRAGADLERADRMGNTALHIAAKINAFDRVMDLLNAGAPPNAINRQHCTFQCYLFMTPANILTKSARDQQSMIVIWLEAHHIAVIPHH
jgi:uncharacterized protein